ncbi:MAG: hypothetical protein RI947_1023 [Candidatus Parcubacteria bacterium]|jgi:large subunit ribosomal protein L1
MGKVRTRILGLEDLETQQKEEQKKKSQEKKMEKSKDADVEAVSSEEVPAEKKPKSKKKEEKSAPTKHSRGKKHVKALKQVDAAKNYTLKEAIAQLKNIKYAAFDESVELHMNIDKEGLKGEVSLPHSTGKTIRVKIVDDKMLEALEKGIIDFDILITHPSFMPKLAKYAKVLGPKGLMPNPKAGTVSTAPEEVAKKFQTGVMRWKSEAKFPLLHQMIAKISLENDKIEENAVVFIQSVGKAHIKEVFIKTTMSPSMKIDIEKL